MQTLRLASVPFVNAQPLIWGFREGPYREITTVLDASPARIPDLLGSRQIDLGLVPSIEIQRLPGVEMLPHLCIASKRRARSVLLASKVPFDRMRTIALDENSRTSAALLKILLAHKGLRDVVYAEQPPALRQMLRDSDAALLIGDSALTADTGGLAVMDLGAEWFAITGLPFVFAVWAARAGTSLPDGLRPFLESRQMGIANIPAIAREAGARLRLAPQTIEDYLRINLHYHLGSEEARGLDLFFRQARELDLVPSYRPAPFLDTVDRQPAGANRDRP